MTKGVGSAIAMSCRHLREDLFLKIYVRRGRLLVIALVFFILFAAGVAALEFLCLTDSDGNLLLWKDRLLCYRSYALVCMTATVALMLLYVAAMEKMASGAEPRRGDKYGEKPHAGRRDAFRADKYKEALRTTGSSPEASIFRDTALPRTTSVRLSWIFVKTTSTPTTGSSICGSRCRRTTGTILSTASPGRTSNTGR